MPFTFRIAATNWTGAAGDEIPATAWKKTNPGEAWTAQVDDFGRVDPAKWMRDVGAGSPSSATKPVAVHAMAAVGFYDNAPVDGLLRNRVGTLSQAEQMAAWVQSQTFGWFQFTPEREYLFSSTNVGGALVVTACPVTCEDLLPLALASQTAQPQGPQQVFETNYNGLAIVLLGNIGSIVFAALNSETWVLAPIPLAQTRRFARDRSRDTIRVVLGCGGVDVGPFDVVARVAGGPPILIAAGVSLLANEILTIPSSAFVAQVAIAANASIEYGIVPLIGVGVSGSLAMTVYEQEAP